MITRRSLAATALTAALAVAALLTTGSAASAARPPQAHLQLSVTAEAGPQLGTAVLTCYPAGGNHPRAAAACSELGRAGGNPDRLRPGSLACTLEYAPVTATATGHWRGRLVTWSKVYSNRCMLHVATGAVFRF
jgi:hypothetical protein